MAATQLEKLLSELGYNPEEVQSLSKEPLLAIVIVTLGSMSDEMWHSYLESEQQRFESRIAAIEVQQAAINQELTDVVADIDGQLAEFKGVTLFNLSPEQLANYQRLIDIKRSYEDVSGTEFLRLQALYQNLAQQKDLLERQLHEVPNIETVKRELLRPIISYLTALINLSSSDSGSITKFARELMGVNEALQGQSGLMALLQTALNRENVLPAEQVGDVVVKDAPIEGIEEAAELIEDQMGIFAEKVDVNPVIFTIDELRAIVGRAKETSGSFPISSKPAWIKEPGVNYRFVNLVRFMYLHEPYLNQIFEELMHDLNLGQKQMYVAWLLVIEAMSLSQLDRLLMASKTRHQLNTSGLEFALRIKLWFWGGEQATRQDLAARLANELAHNGESFEGVGIGSLVAKYEGREQVDPFEDETDFDELDLDQVARQQIDQDLSYEGTDYRPTEVQTPYQSLWEELEIEFQEYLYTKNIDELQWDRLSVDMQNKLYIEFYNQPAFIAHEEIFVAEHDVDLDYPEKFVDTDEVAEAFIDVADQEAKRLILNQNANFHPEGNKGSILEKLTRGRLKTYTEAFNNLNLTGHQLPRTDKDTCSYADLLLLLVFDNGVRRNWPGIKSPKKFMQLAIRFAEQKQQQLVL